MSKYHSKSVAFSGQTFDSKKEFLRWQELCLLEKSGKIQGLRRQVKYELIPSQFETYERYSTKTGKRLKDGRKCVEKAIHYIADFVYSYPDGSFVVEDAKGVRTDSYVMKRKLMLWIHGIRIKET